MDKQDVIDYVMNTPGNTNRAVLSGILDSFNSGGEEVEYIQRIIAVTKDDIVACADENNVVNEYDLIEYVIRKHIGNVNCADGSGYYFLTPNFASNGATRPFIELQGFGLVSVYFMGSSTQYVTDVNFGINITQNFSTVWSSISKATDLSVFSTITIDEVQYSLVALHRNSTSFYAFN